MRDIMIDIKSKVIPAAAACLLIAAAALPAQADTLVTTTTVSKAPYLKFESLTQAQAKNIALRMHPGSVVNETVGSGPANEATYLFDINSGTGAYTVGVSAISGRVIENKRDGARIENKNIFQRMFGWL
jgi:uncharacterized membrane protein YkoI